MWVRCSTTVIATLLFWSAAQVGAGQLDVEAARRAHRLSTDVMSPFCPGRTLADCPSPDAAALRKEVRALLDAGRSEDEVRSMLERHFGDSVVGVPRSPLAWLLPLLALGLGLVGLAFALRRLAARPEPGGPTEDRTALDASLEAELDAEIRAQT